MKYGTRVTVSLKNSLLIDLSGKEGIVEDYDDYNDLVQVAFDNIPQLIWLQRKEVIEKET